jgi:hypothetical protein
MSDFKATDHGTVVGFAPLTEAAQEFLDENVHIEDWQWVGQQFYVDHRPAQNLIDGIVSAGLSVGG